MMLLLLVACVVELPPFGGSTEVDTPTGETGTDTGGSPTGDTATAPTGETGATPTPTGHTGGTGDTGDTGVPSSCVFGDVAATGVDTLLSGAALDDFLVLGTTAPVPGSSGPSSIWYPRSNGQLQQRTYNGGTPSETTGPATAPPPIDSLRSAIVDGTTYLLLQSGTRDLQVLDETGASIASASVRSQCLAPYFGLTVVPDFDGAAGHDLVHTCLDSGNFASLRSRKVTDATTFIDDETVSWTVQQASGFLGVGFRSLVAGPDGTAWVADRSDGYEPHRAWLVDWRTPDIQQPTDAHLVISDTAPVTTSSPPIDGPSPVPVSVDIDNDGTDDVVVAMPTSSGGELWILHDVPTAMLTGGQLGRDDMDVVLIGGTALDRIDQVAVLSHDDGGRGVVLGGAKDGQAVVALLPSVPTTAAAPVPVEDLATAVLKQPQGTWDFVWDLVPAGDYDDDGCTDVVVHVASETYVQRVGEGTAFVLSGR